MLMLWQAREPVLQPRTQGYLSRDECGPVVGMPKVALLFLTRGPMTHENLWSRWFEQAAGEPSQLQSQQQCAWWITTIAISVGTWPGVRRTAFHMCTLHPSLSSLVWLERCN